MQEIKFKAYIKNLKWILPVERINFDCKTVEIDLSAGNGDTSEYDFDEIILMQFIGLRDIHNKEIYVGDIVKQACKDDDDYGLLGEIVYNEQTLSFSIKPLDNNTDESSYVIFNKDKFEIVSNIYDENFINLIDTIKTINESPKNFIIDKQPPKPPILNN